MTEQAQALPKDKSRNSQLLVRTVLLAIWVALVDLWLARHFRTGLSINELSMTVGVPLASLFSVGVVDYLVGRDSRESAVDSIKNYFRHFMTTHLSTRVLSLLFILSTAIAATYSTISIAPTGGNHEITVTPVALQEPVISDHISPSSAKDIHLWINPFATRYELAISGFLPKVITVKPFLGTTILPAIDLLQMPTVLFRPSIKSYEVLGSGGQLELYRKANETFEKIAEDSGTHAWYIGARRNQPGELRNEWQLEAQALGLGEQVIAILMKRWRNPKLLTTVALGPDEIICALVSNVERKVIVAGVVGTIERQEYIDLPLGDIENDVAKVHNNTDGNPGSNVCNWLDGGAG